jgi:hypothetical protein
VAQVDQALAATTHVAKADDRRHLLTHAYTDAALALFFDRLRESGLAERSIVVLAADHSTGFTYVWHDHELQGDEVSDNAKSRIPFLVVLPEAMVRHGGPRAREALARAQHLLATEALSQNDIPRLLLALLQASKPLANLAPTQRWHTLGGQVTSPWFPKSNPSSTQVLGINGISELFRVNGRGERQGAYEESMFLKTRADRYSTTPSLLPVSAALVPLLQETGGCDR